MYLTRSNITNRFPIRLEYILHSSIRAQKDYNNTGNSESNNGWNKSVVIKIYLAINSKTRNH